MYMMMFSKTRDQKEKDEKAEAEQDNNPDAFFLTSLRPPVPENTSKPKPKCNSDIPNQARNINN